MSEFLWLAAKKKNPPKNKPKPKPKPPTNNNPTPPASEPGVLTQNNCAFINTNGLPINGSTDIVWPGCSTITLYESFTSAAAQAVWTKNQRIYFGAQPSNPNGSGLLVATTASGIVSAMLLYAKGTQFTVANAPYQNISQYTWTRIVAGYARPQVCVIKNSPNTTVSIPANIYGGVNAGCSNSSAPKP